MLVAKDCASLLVSELECLREARGRNPSIESPALCSTGSAGELGPKVSGFMVVPRVKSVDLSGALTAGVVTLASSL